jgi:hypothetical protein
MRRKVRAYEDKLCSSRKVMEKETFKQYKVISKAHGIIKNSMNPSIEDQRDVLEKMCEIIVDGRMQPDSLPFNIISTIVRT